MAVSKDDNPHKLHRQRMKNRFLKEGFDTFDEHNILEMMLYYAIPVRDTNLLAHELIERFGSLNGVIDASYEELLSIKGVGENTATYLRALSGIIGVYYNSEAKSGKVIYDSQEKLGDFFVKKIMSRTQEVVLALFLDNSLEEIGCEMISKGSLTSASIDTRKIVSLALRNHSYYVVLAHNHPKGDIIPSNDDVIATSYLKNALGTIDIELLDHIIVSQRRYGSLAQMGYL